MKLLPTLITAGLIALSSALPAKDDKATPFPVGRFIYIYSQSGNNGVPIEPKIHAAEIALRKDGTKELIISPENGPSTSSLIVEEGNSFVAQVTAPITEDGRKRIFTTLHSGQAGEQCIFGRSQSFRQGVLLYSSDFILLEQ